MRLRRSEDERMRRWFKRHPCPHYMGRFRVPAWLYEVSPRWLHRFADVFGGVQ